jgi:hypothetical protein
MRRHSSQHYVSFDSFVLCYWYSNLLHMVYHVFDYNTARNALVRGNAIIKRAGKPLRELRIQYLRHAVPDDCIPATTLGIKAEDLVEHEAPQHEPRGCE